MTEATAAPAPRFLLVRLGALGDVVHAMPAAAALRARYPTARIDWLVDPRYAPMLDLLPAVDSAIAVDTHHAKGAMFTAVRRLRQAAYDAAIDLQGLVKSATVARASGATRTIGYARADLREPMAAALYSETVDVSGEAHVIGKGLRLLSAVGVTTTAVHFPLRIPPSAAGDAAERQGGGLGFVAINPGAAWPNKRWPPDRFGAVASAVREQRGLPSLVVWGPGEEDLADAVVAASRGAAVRAQPTTTVELFDVLRRARLLVSGDTGPLHIGAAAGTPVVALFGPTRPERNGPWSPADITVSRLAECICPYQRRCRRTRPCLDDVTVDEVMRAVGRRMDTHG